VAILDVDEKPAQLAAGAASLAVLLGGLAHAIAFGCAAAAR
jgi:hypothetical protein